MAVSHSRRPGCGSAHPLGTSRLRVMNPVPDAPYSDGAAATVAEGSERAIDSRTASHRFEACGAAVLAAQPTTRHRDAVGEREGDEDTAPDPACPECRLPSDA